MVGAQGHHQRVTMALSAQRLDRRAFVNHARIVQQQQRPSLRQGEPLASWPVGVEHARLAPFDVLSVDHEHGNEIHAIAVRAFWRGPANAVGRVDAKLVRFDTPMGRLAAHLIGGGGQSRQQLGPCRLMQRSVQNGFEPTFHPAVKCVVVQRLPVGAVRHLRQCAVLKNKAAVASASVAAAIL